MVKSNEIPHQAFHSSQISVGLSCQERPRRPVHSISTTSLLPSIPVEDNNVYTDGHVYRTRSKPDLEKHQLIGDVNEVAGGAAVRTPFHHLTHPEQDPGIGLGLQLALMNLKSLQNQTSLLKNHLTATWHHQPNQNITPSHRLNLQTLLDNTMLSINDSTANLELACSLVGAGRPGCAGDLSLSTRSTPVRDLEHCTSVSSSRKFSQSGSSAAIPISRQSSGLSFKGSAKATNNLTLSGSVDARKQLSFDHCK